MFLDVVVLRLSWESGVEVIVGWCRVCFDCECFGLVWYVFEWKWWFKFNGLLGWI